MNDFKFGFCDWMLPMPGLESLTLAAQLGYDGVQYLESGAAGHAHPFNNPWVQKVFKATMAQTGMQIQLLMLFAIAQKGLVKHPPQTAEGRAGLEEISLNAQACKALGIKRLMLFSLFEAQVKDARDLENTAAFLKAAAKILRDEGLELIYESFLPFNDTVALYEQTDKTFKLCYDTANPLLMDFGRPAEELPGYLERGMVDCVHLKDAPQSGGGMALLGAGNGVYKQCAEILRRFNYKGWLVSETPYYMDETGEVPQLMIDDLEVMRRDFG